VNVVLSWLAVGNKSQVPYGLLAKKAGYAEAVAPCHRQSDPVCRQRIIHSSHGALMLSSFILPFLWGNRRRDGVFFHLNTSPGRCIAFFLLHCLLLWLCALPSYASETITSKTANHSASQLSSLTAPRTPTAASNAVANRVLRLGLYHYPPFYFTEQVIEPYGLAKDLLTPVTKAFNVTLEIIPCPFARCLKMLTDGDIDVMPGLIKTPQRTEHIHFLQPAMMEFASSFAFYSHRALKTPIRQFSDLHNLTIAVMRDAAYFPQFDQATLRKVAVPSESDALYLVQQQHADVAVMVEGTAAGAFAHAGLTMDDLVRQPYAVDQQILGYLGLSKASPWFAKAPQIEQQLQLLYRQGWYERLWLHYQVPLPAQNSTDGQPSVNQAQSKR